MSKLESAKEKEGAGEAPSKRYGDSVCVSKSVLAVRGVARQQGATQEHIRGRIGAQPQIA